MQTIGRLRTHRTNLPGLKGTETQVAETVRRVTREPYGHSSRKRHFIVTIEAPDLITVKPVRGSAKQSYSINVYDLWAMLVRNQAAKRQLEKARDKRAKLKVVREHRARLDAERRFKARNKKERETYET
jgi:hypothetical protein